MNITSTDLNWQGPFPLSELEGNVYDAEGKCGVYLLIQRLEQVSSVYVGSSSGIASRLRDHIRATLALDYYILEREGEWHPQSPPPKAFWSRVSNLRNEIERCVTVLEETSFAWAETTPDRVNTTERAIYERLLECRERGELVIHNGAPIGKSANQIEQVVISNRGAEQIIRMLGSDVVGPSP